MQLWQTRFYIEKPKTMRGSIQYQTGELAKILFKPGMPKYEQKSTGFIANAATLETYREVWNELGIYVKDEFAIKDLQALTHEHIEAFMIEKSYQDISEQYLELISSALGKLEIALGKLNAHFCLENPHYAKTKDRTYDFSIRQQILNDARKNKLVIETSDDPNFTRAYENPKALIDAMEDPSFKLAAQIQYESGARLEGVKRIDQYTPIKTRKLADNTLEDIIEYTRIDEHYSKVTQLQGTEFDVLEGTQKGRIFDIEKGGKPGILLVSVNTYQLLKAYLLKHETFLIVPDKYREALKEAAKITQQKYHGTHGLRWNYAKERLFKIQVIGGLTYEQALQEVSWAMKHERASISEHYLG